MKRIIKVAAILTLIVALTACSRPVSTQNDKITGEDVINSSGASQAMYNKDYWINKTKNPDKVIMDGENIKKYNKEMANLSALKYYDLNEYPTSFDKDSLKSMVNIYGVPSNDRYIGDKKTTKAYNNKLQQSKNIQGIQEKNDVRYGFVTKETALRDFPTDDVSYESPNDYDFDKFFECKLKVWERVAILHTSLDRKWYYVQGVPYMGWIKAADVAVTDRQTWSSYENRDFLVVTGNRITLDEDPHDAASSRLEMLMGTRLPLGQTTDFINGVSTQSSHVVLLPGRNETGMFYEKTARVPISADVNVGYLPYTKGNIISQGYKMLGERYGWGGSLSARDCSAFLRDIYFTFGIELPRNSASQASIPSEGKLDVSNMNDKDKEAAIIKQEPGTLIEFKGHIMLYLGSVDGKAYALHDVYAYGKSGQSGANGRDVINCVNITDMYVTRQDGSTFISNIRNIVPVRIK